ncbi:hypothetical protein ABKA04_006880 [Annulohypoxylon sp. FPYF3050]
MGDLIENVRPTIVIDANQPYMADLRYDDKLPARYTNRSGGFDKWFEKWKDDFTKAGFQFHNREHTFETAYKYNLSEVSRRALANTVPNQLVRMEDICLKSDEIEVGLRMATDGADAWVPLGDLMTDDDPGLYKPRKMCSKDRAGVAEHKYTVFPDGFRWKKGQRQQNLEKNFRSFLEFNGMNAEGIQIEPLPFPIQRNKYSCGWIALESARAWAREGKTDWTDSKLYDAYYSTVQPFARERAAMRNWSLWAAVSWRGARESWVNEEQEVLVEDTPPGTYQAESAELLKQEGQLGLLGLAQPVQPVKQEQPAKAPTSVAQKPLPPAPAPIPVSARPPTPPSVPPTVPPTPAWVEPPLPPAPTTTSHLITHPVRPAANPERFHLLKEAERNGISHEHRYKLVNFILEVKKLPLRPLSLMEYHIILLDKEYDVKKAVQACRDRVAK